MKAGLLNEINQIQQEEDLDITVSVEANDALTHAAVFYPKFNGHLVEGAIATHLTRKAGYTKASAQAGAVTLIQCFAVPLN